MEAGKEAKDKKQLFFFFHRVPSVLLSHHLCCPHTPSTPHHPWHQTPWKGCRVLVVGFSSSSLLFIMFQLISSFPSPPNGSFHGHHSIYAVNPMVNVPPSLDLIYQIIIDLNSTPRPRPPLKTLRMASRTSYSPDLYPMIWLWVSPLFWRFTLHSVSAFGFLMVFLYPPSFTWWPHPVSVLSNAIYRGAWVAQ